jgi:hypothetical protein
LSKNPTRSSVLGSLVRAHLHERDEIAG